MRFDVVAEVQVQLTQAELDAPEQKILPDPVTDRHRRMAAYRATSARFRALRALPGFGGYSLRPGYTHVIDGVHIAGDHW